MDSPKAPMILPKGIVLNSPEIYAEVASYPVVPPEKLWQYWHVYTTTFRRLIDPTAFRLENFWWHVWGSDRRYLSGAVLAKLFEEFSDGPTFVPLKGPDNRYDGPSVPRSSRRPDPTQRHQSDQARPRNQDKTDDGSSTIERKPDLKQPTPSSSRPPPPHPILKKSRGPSASGPRPTARFDVPADSEDEEAKEDEVSSGSTAVAGIDLPPPPFSPRKPQAKVEAQMPPPPRPSQTKSEKKPGPVVGKKFTATTAASKRRPVMARRQNSQSSNGSDAGSREGGSAASAKYLGNPKANHLVEQPTERNSQGSSGSSSTDVLVMSTKAAGKRPARAVVENAPPPRVSPLRMDEHDISAAIQQLPMPAPRSLPTRSPTGSMPTYEINRSRHSLASRSQAPVAGFLADEDELDEAPRMMRSRSDIDSTTLSRERARFSHERSASRLSAQALIASSVVGTSTTTAQGQVDSGLKTPDLPDFPAPIDINQSTLPSRQSASSLANMQFRPTPPSPTPVMPFQRSKSQLAFLLERDKQSQGL